MPSILNTLASNRTVAELVLPRLDSQMQHLRSMLLRNRTLRKLEISITVEYIELIAGILANESCFREDLAMEVASRSDREYNPAPFFRALEGNNHLRKLSIQTHQLSDIKKMFGWNEICDSVSRLQILQSLELRGESHIELDHHQLARALQQNTRLTRVVMKGKGNEDLHLSSPLPGTAICSMQHFYSTKQAFIWSSTTFSAQSVASCPKYS
jgi:hypothetical protein